MFFLLQQVLFSLFGFTPIPYLCMIVPFSIAGYKRQNVARHWSTRVKIRPRYPGKLEPGKASAEEVLDTGSVDRPNHANKVVS